MNILFNIKLSCIVWNIVSTQEMVDALKSWKLWWCWHHNSAKLGKNSGGLISTVALFPPPFYQCSCLKLYWPERRPLEPLCSIGELLTTCGYVKLTELKFRIRILATQLHYPHSKCPVAVSGLWLLYWTAQTENTSLIAESAIGSCLRGFCSPNFLISVCLLFIYFKTLCSHLKLEEKVLWSLNFTGEVTWVPQSLDDTQSHS